MGACATKPKVAKDEAQAPVPPPEPAKEETPASAEVKKEVEEAVVATAVGGEEEKKVVDRAIGVGDDQPGGGGDKLKEVVDADKLPDDDQSSKRQSLSNLFQEKDGQKQLVEGEKAPTETVKSEETEKPIQPPTQEPSVTVAPAESAEPLKLEKSATEKFVEAPEVLPAEEKVDPPVEPTSAVAGVDGTGKVEAEK